MKRILISLVIILSMLAESRAQEPQFQNFQKWSAYKNVWIVPYDIEEKFKDFQQEVMENDLEVGALPLNTGPRPEEYTPEQRRQHSEMKKNLKNKFGIDLDKRDTVHPLVCWLTADKPEPEVNVKEPYPRGWLEAIPSTLTEKLKKCAAEKFAKQDWSQYDYFAVYALVNNKGEALSVYFRIDTALVNVVQEEELRDICDVIVKVPFNPANFSFNCWNRKWIEEFIVKSSDMSGEERKEWMTKIEKGAKPCSYGVVKFFEMTHYNTSNHIRG